MQPVWLFILLGKQFDETYENAQWRKIKEMQLMWLFMFWGIQFEDTFEKAERRKVKEVQPVWLRTLWHRPLEDISVTTNATNVIMDVPWQAIWENTERYTVEKS